jgi:hypothetical protein
MSPSSRRTNSLNQMQLQTHPAFMCSWAWTLAGIGILYWFGICIFPQQWCSGICLYTIASSEDVFVCFLIDCLATLFVNPYPWEGPLIFHAILSVELRILVASYLSNTSCNISAITQHTSRTTPLTFHTQSPNAYMQFIVYIYTRVYWPDFVWPCTSA